MYTWNTLPAMQRGGFSAMLWSASWSRTCCKFLLTLQSFGRFITAPPFPLMCVALMRTAHRYLLANQNTENIHFTFVACRCLVPNGVRFPVKIYVGILFFVATIIVQNLAMC